MKSEEMIHMLGEILGVEPEADDLISRQAAIDAVRMYFDEFHEDVPDSVEDVLKSLPSAQPEIIRCKGCKYWRSDHTCHEHSLVSPMMANDFCSRAERRIDGLNDIIQDMGDEG